MNGLQIRAATKDEFRAAVDWAAAEGWNPGTDDLSAFHAADPAGFIMGFIGNEAVSSISVVRYGDNYGFLGFYIVRNDMRGSGVGIATWNAGISHLKGRTIGLDGVVDQQANYTKSGFAYKGRNVRYTGVPETARVASTITIEDATKEHQPALVAFDNRYFPTPREAFVKLWTSQKPDTGRTTKVAIVDGRIVGYGVIRSCLNGYKIGPLFAETQEIANDLASGLCQTTEAGAEVSLDIPEDNPSAAHLAQSLGFSPVFETARMYKGEAPELPIANIYGITSFELG